MMIIIFTVTVVVNIFRVAQSHAGFDCYCNLNHPEALIFNCPNGQGFPIAALRTPMQVIRYKAVNLQTPYCVPVLVNIQSQGSWVPVYSSGNLGYLNLDADFAKMKCPGMMTFNPNKLVVSPLCHHTITNIPGLSITGTQNKAPAQISTTSQPWQKITQGPTTTQQWLKITQGPTSWFKIPHQTPPTQNNFAKCHGPDVENDLKKKVSIFYHMSRFCPITGAASDEVTAVKYCSAPEPKLWKPGKHVGSHCNSLNKYTPISVFQGGKTNGDGTAILLSCTQGKIQIARQTCKSQALEVVEIFPTVDLFVVEW